MGVLVKTIGPGLDYATWQAAIDSLPKNLVTNDIQPILQGAKGTEFTSSGVLMNIKDFVCDATHFITLTSLPNNSWRDASDLQTAPPVYDPNRGTALSSTLGYSAIISSNAAYLLVDGLQFKNTTNCKLFDTAGANTVIQNCIVDAFPDGYAVVLAGDSSKLLNSLVVNRITGARCVVQGSAGLVSNCTIVTPADRMGGSGFGIVNFGGSAATVENTAIFGFATAVGGNTVNGTNNFTDVTFPASMSGLTGLVYANQFVNVNNNTLDMRLKSGSALIDGGKTTTYGTSANRIARPSGTAFDGGFWEFVSPATALTLSGPSNGSAGSPVQLTISTNGSLSSNVTVTLSDNGASGAFNPSTVTLTPTSTYAQVNYTKLSSGTVTISATNNGGLTNPANITVNIAAAPPTGAVTSQNVDGNDVTITFSTTNNPASALFTVTPSSGPAVNGTVNLGSGTGNAQVNNLSAGTYTGTITLTNSGGSNPVSGVQQIVINSMSGSSQAPDSGNAPVINAPGAPQNVVATAGDGVVSVEFVAPVSDGGGTIDRYTATASNGTSVDGANSPISLFIPNGTAVTVSVVAHNSAGNGPATVSNSVTPSKPIVITVPGSPRNVAASAGDGRAVITFDVPLNNGGSPILDYTVTASTGQTATSTASPVEVVVPNGITVTFTVTARNSAGVGSVSNTSTPVTPTSTAQPIVVRGVVISPQSLSINGGATLQMSAIVDVTGTNALGTVTWTTDRGQISVGGLLGAPAGDVVDRVALVRATSNDDPTKSATAIITIIAAPPQPIPVRLRNYSANVRTDLGTAVEKAIITVFDQETRLKLDLWADAAKTKPVLNPMITDDAGFFQFFTEAAQCGYTVRGDGIRTYSRENIFDIANSIDLTPLQTQINQLQSTKASNADLQNLSANKASNGDLIQLSSRVDGLSTLLNPVISVQAFVTSGLGTLASPWTGWDTRINWSENTEYQFLDGYYGYVDSPNFAKNNLRLKGRKGTVLVHTGNSYALLVNAGPNNEFVKGVSIDLQLRSNAGAAGGVYAVGCFGSSFNIEFLNTPNVCFQEFSCQSNEYRLKLSTLTVPAVPSQTLIRSGKRNTQSLKNQYYLIAEGCTGNAVILTDVSDSVFIANEISDNYAGFSISNTSNNNQFINATVARSSFRDIQCEGSGNLFSNLRTDGELAMFGPRNQVIGGFVEIITNRADNNTFTDVSYGGSFSDSSSSTVKRNVFNSLTQTVDNDRTNAVRDFVSHGKTTLGADTLNIGNGQMYKTPNGLFGINTSSFVNDGPLQVTNPNNTTTAEGIRNVLGTNALTTTAKHHICNTGGTDVLTIFGNGNVQNVNNSYGAVSDARLKENVVDASDKLENLLKVRVVNYNLIGQEERLIGVIADELEKIFPGMVETIDGYKTVKYSVFVLMLIKALQELNEKIENGN